MLSPVLPLLVSCFSTFQGPLDLQATSANIFEVYKKNPSAILIAHEPYDDPYGPNPHGRNPHGPDPHDRDGLDPHDERHDPNMPANRGERERDAPRSPYGR